MRLFAASLATETNTVSPVSANLRDFWNNFNFSPGKHPDTPSLCSAPSFALREHKEHAGDAVEVIEGAAAWAGPGGTVSRVANLHFRDKTLGQLQSALPVELQGVTLIEHERAVFPRTE